MKSKIKLLSIGLLLALYAPCVSLAGEVSNLNSTSGSGLPLTYLNFQESTKPDTIPEKQEVPVKVEDAATKTDSTAVKDGTSTDTTKLKPSLDLKDLNIKDLINVLDTIKNRDKKYTLDPDSAFFGFSTGASFEFVDGLDDASLFIDLTANVGQVLEDWLSAEFGVLSGRFAPTTSIDNPTVSRTLSVRDQPQNGTYELRSVRGVENNNFEYNRKFTRAFATGNVSLFPKAPKGAKLFLTTQFEYTRMEFDNSVLSEFTPQDTVTNIFDRNRPDEDFVISLSDTVNAKIVQDRTAVMLGARLFKRHQDFEFRISALFGHTWINQVDRVVTSTSGRRLSSNETVGLNISNDNNFMYVIKGSVLEKKLLGAKIGFEIRNIFDSGESPEYYFFISKQFSMQEFFRLFSPGG